MRISILSRSASIGSTRRLVEAGRARGHKVRVISPLRVRLHLDGRKAHLFYGERRMPRCDVVIPRIAASVNVYGLAVVNQFALQGIPVLNSADAIAQARNKMRSLQLLSAHGVDIPATVMAREPSELKEMVDLVGGVPVLVKLLQGQERRGVMVCESLQSLGATLEAVLGLGHHLMVQQYVKKADQDLRVLVVGGRALAAVRRQARPGRIFQTLNMGARFRVIPLTPALAQAAEKAAQLVGLEVAAVDMLGHKGAPKVFEVNSSPNLCALEEATGLDLAGAIIERAEALLEQQGRPSR
jgi:ribosomal protein S6--L-glutamate ligase